MSITILQLHKRASYVFEHIQDKYAINSDNKSFALADGTTQSFNSEIWAEIITNCFVENPTFNANELIASFTKVVELYKNSKFEYSKNPAKASLEKEKTNKGGTATFIGLQFNNDNKINVISCGDTNLFLLNSENKIIAFPYSDVDTLDTNNHFINTEKLLQNDIDETFFRNKTLEYNNGDKLILATDALSRLILKKPKILNELFTLTDFSELHSFCLKYWDNKELEEDDISAIIVTIENNSDLKAIYPPKEFSFPKEKEEEFIPTSLKQQYETTNYTDMQMNEIKNQFNGVANDFRQVKKKQKLHEILLMVVISLLLLNILIIYFVSPESEKEVISDKKTKTESAIIEKYENTIEDLNSELKSLTTKITEIAKPTVVEEETKSTKVEVKKATSTPSKEEAKKRQEELNKAGYKVTADGIWGDQSEKYWKEFQAKKTKSK